MTDGPEPHTSGMQSLVSQVYDVGGDLVTVLSWSQYANVTKGTQLALAEIVGAHDDLNTLAAVDYIIDAAVYHNQDLGMWWPELLRNHSLEHVVLALNTMRELGWRRDYVNDKIVEPDEFEDQLTLEDLIEFIEQVTALGFEIVTAEGLADFINRCGGWDVAQGLGDDQILDLQDNPALAAELLREHLKAIASKSKKEPEVED